MKFIILDNYLLGVSPLSWFTVTTNNIIIPIVCITLVIRVKFPILAKMELLASVDNFQIPSTNSSQDIQPYY